MFALESTVTWLIIGLLFIGCSIVVNYLNDMRETRKPNNDRYLPARDINSIGNERYNKNNWS